MEKEEINEIKTKHDLLCNETNTKTSANTDMLQIDNKNKVHQMGYGPNKLQPLCGGITLISLIITIIILLILAGVTINLTLGENGIFGLAQDAGKNYLDAQEQEKKMLANIKVGEYVNGTKETVTLDEYNKLKNEYDKFKKDITQALNGKNCNLNQNENNDKIIKSINGLLVGNVQKIAEDLSGNTSQSISVSNIEGYEHLTEDNFILVLKRIDR